MSSRSAPAARRPRASSAPAARPASSSRAGSGSGSGAARSGTAGGGARRSARPTAAQRRRTKLRRRRVRIGALLVAAIVGLVAIAVSSGMFDHAVREIRLPLRHEDIIRQQAADKQLDPALIAGVIYTESHFRDGQVSSAGAEGLMQLTPATAKDIARKSGGVLFEEGDLATPQVNISYGAYYLRYLLNRFGGDEALALAAYNGGEGNVERWVAAQTAAGGSFRVADIPFAETREYVTRVRTAERQYRSEYARELGL